MAGCSAKMSNVCIWLQLTVYNVWYGIGVDNTVEKNSQHLLPNPNALFATSKGMWAVKCCTNEVLQFLTGGAG